MKRKQQLKTVLTLLLCGLATTAKAGDGDIINEDFSDTDFSSLVANTLEKSVNDWTFKGCYIVQGAYPKSLKLELNPESGKAYAITPKFSSLTSTGNAILTFKYANTSSNKAIVSITINGNGKFDNGGKTWTESKKSNSAVFNNVSLRLYGVDNNTTLTFNLGNSYYYAIDDVKVSTPDEITLDESSTSNTLADKYADVTIGRTLTGGSWNTLCLPFPTGPNSLKQALGNDQDIQIHKFDSYASNTMNFVSVDTIAAGEPFLLKLNTDVTNPTFELAGLTTTAAQTITKGGASMVGVYDKTELNNGELFLTASGQLKKATSGSTIKGLRAYFTVPTAGARIAFSTGGVASIDDEPLFLTDDDGWYTLNGQRLDVQPTRKGIYIRNGKKVIIK